MIDAYAAAMSPAASRRVAGARRAGSPRARGERIGILGGTFDPPHCGHVTAARAAHRVLGLDRLLLVVANEPWQKVPHRQVTPAEDRFAMVQAVAASIPEIEASRIEIDRGGPSYTADTVDTLLADADASRHVRPDLYLVVGSDLVEALPTWKRVEDLRRRVTLAVVSRPHTEHPAMPEGWTTALVEADTVAVSSSEVRDRLARGLPVDGLVPPEVIRCIHLRGLYAVPR